MEHERMKIQVGRLYVTLMPFVVPTYIYLIEANESHTHFKCIIFDVDSIDDGGERTFTWDLILDYYEVVKDDFY